MLYHLFENQPNYIQLQLSHHVESVTTNDHLDLSQVLQESSLKSTWLVYMRHNVHIKLCVQAVGRAEFAKLLNIEPETLDARIREGRYKKPFKDGRKSYWLLSYVQSVVTNTSESDTVAA